MACTSPYIAPPPLPSLPNWQVGKQLWVLLSEASPPCPHWLDRVEGRWRSFFWLLYSLDNTMDKEWSPPISHLLLKCEENGTTARWRMEWGLPTIWHGRSASCLHSPNNNHELCISPSSLTLHLLHNTGCVNRSNVSQILLFASNAALMLEHSATSFLIPLALKSPIILYYLIASYQTKRPLHISLLYFYLVHPTGLMAWLLNDSWHKLSFGITCELTQLLLYWCNCSNDGQHFCQRKDVQNHTTFLRNFIDVSPW